MLAAAYDAARPAFDETGSPRLPLGLNLGAQLYWQFQTFAQAKAASAILPYPQYWAFRLCGVAATEATSLGAHTDLWNPRLRDLSSLVDRQGWRQLMPPVRGPGEPARDRDARGGARDRPRGNHARLLRHPRL